MDILRKLFKITVFTVVVIFFVSAGYACKPHKCVANGGEQPKKVNPYTKRKPQSGLFDKKMRRR